MKKTILFSIFVLTCLIGPLQAQELNATIQIQAPQIQGVDKQVFETLKKDMVEFFNNRKWTNDPFLIQEKIDCSMLITISEHPSSDEWKATIQVQTRRPVYKSTYFSPLINFNDQDFTFHYVEFAPLEFNDQSFTNTLTSALAFYAYMIIGLDYDSYGNNAGTPYFQKAQAIVDNARNAPEKGWRSNESTRNRYWLVENMFNAQVKTMHDVYYKYHRLGMDVMHDNVANGRNIIIECLEQLKVMNVEKPNTLILQTFFAAKADELVNVFSEAPPEDKNRAFTLLNELDPTNIMKYQKITNGK